jgi:hypothetical protein
VRHNRHGPNILRTVWQRAQDANIEPSYRLLWAVVILGADAAERPQHRTARRRVAPVVPVAPAVPQPVTPYTPPWLPGRRTQLWRRRPDASRLIAIVRGESLVRPLTFGEDRPSPHQERRNRLARVLETAILSGVSPGVRPSRETADPDPAEYDNSIGGPNDYAYGC